MTYTSNHDQNAWDGTQFERFGPALQATIVLSVLGEGLPLIYNGQEAGNQKRLDFFEKDPIQWREHPLGTLFHRSEEHTSELQSLMRISYAVFCLKKTHTITYQHRKP